MGDTNAGEIKAKVTIEYDGSGIDKAKEDLSSLTSIAGGDLPGSLGAAGDAMQQLGEQAGRSAEGTQLLGTSMTGMSKVLGESVEPMTRVTEVMGDSQLAIAGMASSLEDVQKPIEGTTALLEDVAPPMLAIGEHASSLEESMGTAATGFSNMGDSLAQVVPMLPQFADSLHSVSEEFDPKAFGLDAFTENLGVFQDALSNPFPFSMIQQHLSETGQTWDDFTSSIGEENTSFLQGMAENAASSGKAFSTISDNVQSMGGAFSTATGGMDDFSKTWDNIARTTENINEFGGVGSDIYGPAAEAVKQLNKGINEFGGVGANLYAPSNADHIAQVFSDYQDQITAIQGINEMGGVGGLLYGPHGLSGDQSLNEVGFGGALGGATEGIMGFMNQIAMPLMAVQMIGMAVGQAGQQIYNMAAIAEGPGAHGVGTFTGTVDALGQTVQDTAAQFSEGFGKQIIPTLNQLNYEVSTNGGASGGLGGGIGQALQTAFNVFRAATFDPIGGYEGLVNQGASLFGLQQPFQGPTSTGQLNIAQIQEQVALSAATLSAQANNPEYLQAQAFFMKAEGNNPQYLQAQAYLQSQTKYAELGQTYYDTSHSSGMSAFDYAPYFYQQSMQGTIARMPYATAGISSVDINRAFFNGMDTTGAPLSYPGVVATWNSTNAAGCFPAGTRVQMADGTLRDIETLRAGDQVLAYDGTEQIATTILAHIVPPPKMVYRLTLSSGGTLTLTDSHPISTTRGWRSLSPEAAEQENPGLVKAPLAIGDRVHTLDGLQELATIEPVGVLPIFNISVNDPHTFYADGVLVHNKVAGMAQQFLDTPIPQTDMKNSPLIQSIAANFQNADLTHTFTATVNWAAQGLEKDYTASVSWAAQGLSQAYTAVAQWASQGLNQLFTAMAQWNGQNLQRDFTAAANWAGQNLQKDFTAAANWVTQGELAHTFQGIVNWLAQGGLQHTFEGIASWVAQGGLEHTFQGIVNWAAQGLEHTFTAVANWVGQNLNPTFSLSMGSVPGFASGVQNYGGGLAVVGEHGPELVYLPQGTSVYPQTSSGFAGIGSGDGGMVTVNVTHVIQLDGKTMAQATIPHVAPMIRQYAGRRSA